MHVVTRHLLTQTLMKSSTKVLTIVDLRFEQINNLFDVRGDIVRVYTLPYQRLAIIALSYTTAAFQPSADKNDFIQISACRPWPIYTACSVERNIVVRVVVVVVKEVHSDVKTFVRSH